MHYMFVEVIQFYGPPCTSIRKWKASWTFILIFRTFSVCALQHVTLSAYYSYLSVVCLSVTSRYRTKLKWDKRLRVW